MDVEHKLELLAPAARFEVCDSETRAGKKPPRANATPPAAALFRVLMSSRCAWNCAYCPLRAGNDTPRTRLSPDELASSFMARAERNATTGLFLSSAVDESVDRSMEQMLDAVEILRQRHSYQGYIHLKLLPGTAYSDVERASRLADRLSLNLEAPNSERLARIAPQRSHVGDLLRLSWARDFGRGDARPAPRRAGASRLKAGLATQLVVGAAGESDREIVATSAQLYGQLGLRRVYFGAFRPVAGTPLAEMAPTPLSREQRLSQADWLLRHYGFADGELPFGPDGNLPLGVDPKLAWALAHPELFPVEINRADPELLLRVPGVGPIAVRRIVRLRAQGSFREPEQLKGTGARTDAARDFLSFDGRFFGRPQTQLARHYLRPAPVEAEQLSLW